MIAQTNGQAGFKVVPVGTVKADLRQYHQDLMQHGKGAAFLDVLRRVNERLHHDPRGFGETLYHLPALKLVVHQGIIRPLVVTYGGHDELPIVFVHVVKLLSHPTS